MKTRIPFSALLAAFCAPIWALGCETETPTTAVVLNAYPMVPDGGDTSKAVTVYRVWWVTTLFSDPIAPAGESDAQRIVPDEDYAYALLASGWDASSMAPPTTLIPVRSAAKLSARRGDTLHIVVSATAFVGDCAAGNPLSQADADFMTQRIFPGAFRGVEYDAGSCTLGALLRDGGPDGGATASPSGTVPGEADGAN